MKEFPRFVSGTSELRTKVRKTHPSEACDHRSFKGRLLDIVSGLIGIPAEIRFRSRLGLISQEETIPSVRWFSNCGSSQRTHRCTVGMDRMLSECQV